MRHHIHYLNLAPYLSTSIIPYFLLNGTLKQPATISSVLLSNPWAFNLHNLFDTEEVRARSENLQQVLLCLI